MTDKPFEKVVNRRVEVTAAEKKKKRTRCFVSDSHFVLTSVADGTRLAKFSAHSIVCISRLMCDLAFFKVSVSVKYAERTPESEILSLSQKKFHTIS